MHKFLLLFLSFLSTAIIATAQATDDGSAMEKNGKIYVVMAVCLTVLIGLIIYVIMIDRKVSALEKKND
jgi:CcmD family protein